MENPNYSSLSDDTLLYYHNTIEMLLLTNKLNLKCYALYATNELLTNTKMYFNVIDIFIFIISIAIVIIIIIIIIIIITIIVITIVISITFVKSTWQTCIT